jgi:hypothetical protein
VLCLPDLPSTVSVSSLFDGGVSVVGSWRDNICVSDGSADSLTCVSEPERSRRRRFSVPWLDAPVKLTTHGGSGLCGVSSSRDITCLGGVFGESGDRSVEPERPQFINGGGFSAIAVSSSGQQIMLRRGDDVLSNLLSIRGIAYDGSRWFGDGGASLRSLGRFSGLTAISANCILQNGVQRCFERPYDGGYGLTEDGGLFEVKTVATNVATLCSSSDIGLTQAGTPANPMLSQAWNCGGGCGLDADGGMKCRIFQNGPIIPVPLSARALEVSQARGYYQEAGCARLVSGAIECFTPTSVLEPRVTAIAGLQPGVRMVRGSFRFGCAVSGTNGLQCWRDGVVFALPVDERIVDVQMGTGYESVVCALLGSGRVFCHGTNRFGQLGFLPTNGPHRLVE